MEWDIVPFSNESTILHNGMWHLSWRIRDTKSGIYIYIYIYVCVYICVCVLDEMRTYIYWDYTTTGEKLISFTSDMQQLFMGTNGHRRDDISAPMLLWHLFMWCKRSCFVHILIYCHCRNHFLRFGRRTNSLVTGALMDEITTIITYAYAVACSHSTYFRNGFGLAYHRNLLYGKCIGHCIYCF